MDIPNWLSVTLSILGSLGILTCIGKLIFDTIVKHTKIKMSEIQKYEEQLKEEKLCKTIRQEIQPIRDDLSEVKHQLLLDQKATILELRSMMKEQRDTFCAQGFIETSDKSNWMELYNSYAEMGGNHFKEYVNGWKNDVEQLPIHNNFKGE